VGGRGIHCQCEQEQIDWKLNAAGSIYVP